MNRQLLLIILFLIPVFGLSAVIPVISLKNDGQGTLREAISMAEPGDTIDLQGIDGTISLDSLIRIKKDLEIWGSGANKVFLDGRDKNRILWIETRNTVKIEALTLQNGNAYLDSTDSFTNGGACRNFGNLFLTRCVIRDCQAGFGGGIFNSGVNDGSGNDSANLYIVDCSFLNNKADQPLPNFQGTPKNGGAIGSDARNGGSAFVFVENSTFINNYAENDGGAISIAVDRGDTAIALHLVHCTLTNNEADVLGGAWVQFEGRNYIQNSIISENRGRPDNPNIHGAFYSYGGCMVDRVMMNSSVSYRSRSGTDYLNTFPALGPLSLQPGGLYARLPLCNSPAVGAGNNMTAGSMDIRGFSRPTTPTLGPCEPHSSDTRVVNLADAGYGSLRYASVQSCPGDTLDMRNLEGGISLDSSISIRHNQVWLGNTKRPLILKGSGSHRILTVENGVSFYADFMSLTNGRDTRYGGGAIRNFGKLELLGLSIYDNEAPSGGAIGNYGLGDSSASAYLINCTLARNTASSLDGGAIENVPFDQSARLRLEHCTIAENEALRRGGGIFNLGAAADVDVSLTILTENRAANGESIYGKSVSARGHNLLADTLGTQGSSAMGMGSIINPNATLYPLADNYGGPTRCYALQATSPAIDAGIGVPLVPIDQRGFIRLFGSSADIGAYEYNPLTSIDESSEVHFAVFPNPGTGLFSISGEKLGAYEKLVVCDIYGRTILKQAIDPTAINARFDISKYPSGSYFIKLARRAGKIEAIRFVKE